MTSDVTLFILHIHMPGLIVHDSEVHVIPKTNICVFTIFHQPVIACSAFETIPISADVTKPWKLVSTTK